MDFYKYAEMIDEQGINTKIIAEAIRDHQSMRTRMLDRYGRYKQETANVPIMTREFEGIAAKRINNKLANDYFSEIIDTKVGYMFGLPVVTNYDKKAKGYETAINQIEQFKKINNYDDLNAEMGKFSAMCGYDAGLCYIDKEGQERVIRLDPWESIIISKTAITEPEYGIVYYKTWDERYRVEFYDSKEKVIFEGKGFGESELVEVSRKLHTFDYCPLFGVPNNAELQGDADKVLSLIDGYDRAFSNMADEVEQFRLAYLLYIGYEPDDDVLEEMVKTGALYIPDATDGAKIDWLIKNLDPKYVDSFINRAEANITRFAKHVNFTDAAFGSDITGPAMRYKLFQLEAKAKYFERKHESAMLYMFKVIGSAWNKRQIPFDWTMMDLVYTRNIPVNLLDEAQTATTLAGIASKRTALGVLSVVKDIDEEINTIEQEKAELIDLDDDDLKD